METFCGNNPRCYSGPQYSDSELRWLEGLTVNHWEEVRCMPKKRKRHSAKFKATVALEAVKGIKTLQQLAKDFQVHPTQITIWKKGIVNLG